MTFTASIRKRGDHYQIIVSCGYDVYGRKLTQTASYTPDPSRTEKQQERDLQAFVFHFEEDVKNGIAQDGRKITFKAFADRWMEDYAEQNLQPGTVQKYREELRDKIVPAIGHYKLTEVKPAILSKFLASLAKDGARKDGKPGGYAKSSIIKTRNVISAIMNTAVEWGVLDNNPCRRVKLAPAPETADHIKFFTPEQTMDFLAYIEQPYTVKVGGHPRVDDTGKPYCVNDYTMQKTVPEQIRVLFNMAVYTGLRKGELLALRFQDVDLEKCVVTVSRSATNKQTVKCPKTKTSYRTVSIPEWLSDRISRLKEDRAAYRESVGDFWEAEEDWLFIQENGRMMNYATPYEALHYVIARYNADKAAEDQLPMIPFHGLRHTSATLLIAANQSVSTVAMRLGHAQTSTTMNIYAHALHENDRGAVDALDQMLKKDR